MPLRDLLEEWDEGTMADVARIGIVEDDAALREWLVACVNALEGIELVGAVGTCAAGRELVAKGLNVLLCDLALPDGSGFDLIDAAQGTSARVLVISIFGDVTNVVRAIERGAIGYLLKGESDEQVGASIRTVLAGGAPISPAVAGHILNRMRLAPSVSQKKVAPSKGEPAMLTQRETEVLALLAKGMSYREVAKVHELSHHTVADHVKSIYRKLQVNSKSEAVFEAVQHGLLRL